MKSDLYRKRLDQDPSNILFCFSLGQALFEEQAYQEASEYLLKCADNKADWMMPRILAGKALLELGEPQQARPILEQALQLAIEQHHEDPAEELKTMLQGI